MSAMLSRKLGIQQMDPKLKKASYFAHYKGCRRDPGKNAGATLVLSTKQNDGWFWSIPLEDDVTSIGVVADLERLSKIDGTPEQVLEQEILNCPGLLPRMEGATRISKAHVLKDFSYRATRCAGDGWMLIGDAFGFLDPMYSSGVFLALKSGEMAADAIHDALSSGRPDAANLSRWGEELAFGMTTIRKRVYAFYTPTFSFGKFVKEYPHHKDDVTALLVGDVFKPGADALFEPMSSMAPIPQSIPLQKPKVLREELTV
jgi:flavin-dependent dehydrogenase